MQDILHLLAGTQCTQCGYPSCAAYAEAIETQSAPLNLCRPGGHRVLNALNEATSNYELRITNNDPLPPTVAFIKEEDCIGCTLCLQKCPTSAIIGAPKQVHTVLPNLCIGCNLCVPVCPTACISLQPAPKKHALTQQMPDGSLAPEASQKIWALVEATQARTQNPIAHSLKPIAQQPTVTLNTLNEDLAAKIAAARQKSAEKYAAKGPIRTPRALSKKP